MNYNEEKFTLGALVITANASDRLEMGDVATCLIRHQDGDWGFTSIEDVKTNQRALAEGGRLMSSYADRNGTIFWIITEADRSVTTVLLPEDY